MKHFRLVDNLMGWLTFVIAAFVYCSTIEPTASFWDCPEFITTAYKLEVGHPPGAPFFMLTANLFTQFVSDPTLVALMVNTMSALFSAACIMFLFWSISHLARKLVGENGQVKTLAQLIVVEASALTGALVYTFSDTFWYSAVEGEVYAYSSLFTAVVFWLMLKWEDHADEPGSDRWLIFIAYLTGLSIGVHLLNLLCLPALVLIFYYRKVKNATMKGALFSLVGSGVLIAAVLYGIVPGIVKVGGWFELLFVNTLNMPFNTGVIVYIALLTAIVLWSIWETIKQKSRLRMVLTFLLSVGMLGIPFYGYGWTSIVCGIIVLGLLYLALGWKREGKHVVTARLMNTSLLCMLMIMIGYSSYAVIVIRSSANTPMDQNSPEDIFTLGTYLSREQYGDRPLFYGQAYTSQVLLKPEGNYCVPVSKKGAPVYQRKEKASPDEPDRYEIQRYATDYVYQQNMFFPRMYSEQYAKAYESWMGGVKGTVKTYERCGEMVQIKTPTQLENLRFFLSYQVNFMYWRYFMWNFAGRQNDLQGNGEWEHGNWITGIPFLDNMRLGDQSKLPSELRENKGHNVFYCLPLLLGFIGLLWQLFRNDEKNNGEGEKQFGIVFFLFFMTGLAIVLYLNQTPMQPRERDYAYAGSFYAFAIWVGLGVAGIAYSLRRLLKSDTACALLSCLCILVPIQMAGQTWDDHDRSGRYTCRDFGRNYLESLSKGNYPIIFTNGDNDTFPLWYAQETEGFRTDARVCNLSYLQTDWYIDQMKRPAYDSPAVPIHWSRLQYVAGTREGISVRPGTLERVMEMYKDNPEDLREMLGDNPYELRNIIDRWVLNDNPDLRFIPTDSIVVSVDKEAVRRSGMMMAADSIPDQMHISLKGKRAVYKRLQERADDVRDARAMQLGTSHLHCHDRRSRQQGNPRELLHSGRSHLPYLALQHEAERQGHRHGEDVREPHDTLHLWRHRQAGHLSRRDRSAHVQHPPSHLLAACLTSGQGREARQGSPRGGQGRGGHPVLQRASLLCQRLARTGSHLEHPGQEQGSLQHRLSRGCAGHRVHGLVSESARQDAHAQREGLHVLPLSAAWRIECAGKRRKRQDDGTLQEARYVQPSLPEPHLWRRRPECRRRS